MKRHKHLRFLLIILVFLLAFIWINELYALYAKTIIYSRTLNYPSKGTQEFSVIVLPDTQNYVKNPENEHVFERQAKWIIQNKEPLNIQFVIHVGDIVSTWDSETQWQAADRVLSLLDAHQIPYSVAAGNHEHQTTDTHSETTGFDRYFGVERFKEKPWWGGNYNRSTNSYFLLTINEEGYIFLNLDWCPSADEIQWARDVLINQYPDRKAILTTHGYLNDLAASRQGISRCGSTEYIFDNLIRHVPNLQIVLSGHEHSEDGEAFRIDKTISGDPVYQIMIDYQSEPNGGNGWLKILRFVPRKDKIYLKTYSPFLNKAR
jgi:predicted phosphodiesterase